MKKLLPAWLLLATILVLTSCTKEECITCMPTMNTTVEISSELCQDGDNVIVTTTSGGVSSTETIPGVSINDYETILLSSGFTCD